MSFDLAQYQPAFDIVTLSVRYNKSLVGMKNKDYYRELLDEKFNDFCGTVRLATGRPVQHLYGWKYYVPSYGIHFTSPSPKWGWGRIYFQPTVERLTCVQDWLNMTFSWDLRGIVSLQKAELAFDVYCPELDFDGHEALVPRIAASLVPVRAPNSFVVLIGGKRKQCADGAMNGSLTAYIQSCPKKQRARETDRLMRNLRAAGSTIVYAKEIERSFVRIEHTLNAAKAKRVGIKLDPNNLPALMNMPKLSFSKFWKFKQADPVALVPQLGPMQGLRDVKRILWRQALERVACQPAADQVRLMRCAARGSAKLGRQASRLLHKVPFEQVINTPLPEGFCPSQRMGKHTLPDDSMLPSQITLQAFEHKPLKGVPEPKKLESRLVQLPLPLPETAGSTQNRAHLALCDTICQNATIRTGQAEKCSQSDSGAIFEGRAGKARYSRREGVP